MPCNVQHTFPLSNNVCNFIEPYAKSNHCQALKCFLITLCMRCTMLTMRMNGNNFMYTILKCYSFAGFATDTNKKRFASNYNAHFRHSSIILHSISIWVGSPLRYQPSATSFNQTCTHECRQRHRKYTPVNCGL